MRKTTSPFYSRNYGGLSPGQIDFLLPYLGTTPGPVLDPMAGQAHYLSRLTWEGRRVWIGDINPGPLLLATLRDPHVLMNAAPLVRWLSAAVDRLRNATPQPKPAYCEDWIPKGVREQLQSYVHQLRLDSLGDVCQPGFWEATQKQRFAIAIPLLAARRLTCYTASDNLTWLKKGGLQREYDVYHPLVDALEQWRRYAAEALPSIASTKGALHVQYMNCEDGAFGDCRQPQLIVTSPPYANRLDYTRLWAPEIEMLSSMSGLDSLAVKARQIGTNVILGKSPSKRDLGSLPEFIRDVLNQIREDTRHKASASYYYPFFLNYAVSMTRAFTSLGKELARGGQIVVFVRDTLRKDILFRAGDLVEHVLRRSGVNKTVEKRAVLIRHHVGLMRQNTQAGIHGLAQREWWIVMKKL